MARATIPATPQPELSFVLVAYGTGPILVDTIASIEATAGDRAIEVIVVDNPHPRAVDRSYTELLLGTHGVRVLRPEHNLGFGGGCNAGCEAASGPVVVLLNPDTTLQPGWLQPLLSLLGDATVSIAAPMLINPDGSVQECGQRLFSDGTTYPNRIAPGDAHAVDVDYASAACWVVRRDEFTRLGGFDARFHPAYFEDVDFAVRVRQHGGRCVVHPASVVVHHQGHGTPDLPVPAHAQRELFVRLWSDALKSYAAPTAG